jgi:diguanylate cyclase (GGDEF)-like protein
VFTACERRSFRLDPADGPALWIRLSVEYPPGAEAGTSWYLELNNPGLRTVRLYAPVSGSPGRDVSVLAAGWDIPSSRKAPSCRPVFRLPPDLDPDRPLVLEVTSSHEISFDLYLRSESAHARLQQALFLFLGTCLGGLAAMLLYNGFLYLALGDRHYGVFVLYLLFQLIYQATLAGIIRWLFPVLGVLLIRQVLIQFALMNAGMVQFARAFLDTPRNAPRHDRAFRIALAGMALVALLSLAGRVREGNRLAYFLAQAQMPLLVTASAAALVRGFRPALLFLASSSLLLAAAGVFILRNYGLLPHTLLTFHSVLAGTAAQSILLSFALGQRIRILKEEERRARDRERQLRFASVTDELTGLFNRRHFNAALVQAVGEAEREGSSLSLLMLDVDRFKDFNDEWGHPAGDRVLAELGAVIRASIRDCDAPCRYGGEEFAAILRGADLATARAIAERIRERFALSAFEPRPGKTARVTVSIGAARLTEGESAEAFLERADRALYRAKGAGRNRVEG